MKKLVYTTIAAAALSLGTSVAYGQAVGGVGGNVSGGSFDNSSVTIGGGLGAGYSGTTFSSMDGTSGVATSLEARYGPVSSQAFVAGGNLVGSTSSANFTDITQPFQTSESYQFGANFEQASASAPQAGLGSLANKATVDAMSFQNFETTATTDLSTGYGLGGSFNAAEGEWTTFDIDFGAFGIF